MTPRRFGPPKSPSWLRAAPQDPLSSDGDSQRRQKATKIGTTIVTIWQYYAIKVVKLSLKILRDNLLKHDNQTAKYR